MQSQWGETRAEQERSGVCACGILLPAEGDLYSITCSSGKTKLLCPVIFLVFAVLRWCRKGGSSQEAA